jgi:hypothetical protein
MNTTDNREKGSDQSAVSKEKTVPAAAGSMQSTAPGAQPLGGGKPQAATRQGGRLLEPDAWQAESGGTRQGERGGAGAQQTGWSSRQQAERVKARGEEARQGKTQQSGYGGSEQDQHAGSQESSFGANDADKSRSR